MANLLHQNKKMTVFEVLETIEALRFEEGFVNGKFVSSTNVVIFPRRMRVWTLTKMMEMVLIVFRTSFAEGNFFQLLSWIFWEQEAQTLLLINHKLQGAVRYGSVLFLHFD